ncbi:MAG: diaminopimelate epimerase [Stackebrandtia sp.]
MDGRVHGDLAPEVVSALCDRRAGIGADGVLRVMRSDGEAAWFMDYRNADGSVAEMCGNGVRVFARYLAATRLVSTSEPLAVATRGGTRHVTFCDDGEISADLGVPTVTGEVKVGVEGRSYDALSVGMSNPHAVAFVDTLDEVGELRDAPDYSADDFPDGVNVEFITGPAGNIRMRVHERGVGETRSCGTGAVAAAAVALGGPGTCTVDVPGGRLTVTVMPETTTLTGPAVIVAEGRTNLL